MISAIEWVDGTLSVTFTSGKVYDFHGVPEEKYHEMVKAESVGKWFNANIKGKYE